MREENDEIRNDLESKEKELAEAKDRMTALENQIEEYAGTIDDQSRVSSNIEYHIHVQLHMYIHVLYITCVMYIICACAFVRFCFKVISKVRMYMYCTLK